MKIAVLISVLLLIPGYEGLIGSVVTAASRTAKVAVTRLLVETADKMIVKVSTIRNNRRLQSHEV